MCKPASFKIVKGPKALWSKRTDSHNEIEKEHGIPINTAETIYNVSVEIVPPNGYFATPLKDWVFAVDQDMLPKWWNAEEAEKETRLELVKWADAKLRQAGNNRDIVDGDDVIAVCGGTVHAVCGGTVHAVWGGTVHAVRGGTVNAVWGGTVNEVRGGTVNAVCGGTVSFRCNFSVKFSGLFSVIINRIGEKAKCYVGKTKERIVKG